MVPSARLAEQRLNLAAAGLPKTGRMGFELFDKQTLGATEFTEHVNYRRALEGELERSVMALAEVEQARGWVECGLPGGEQSDEVFDPARSVMVSSQRTEDSSGPGAANGVPGTASTLPRPTSRPGTSAKAVTRTTESINYQSTRTVKK